MGGLQVATWIDLHSWLVSFKPWFDWQTLDEQLSSVACLLGGSICELEGMHGHMVDPGKTPLNTF